MEKISKKEAEEKIKEFFSGIAGKSPEEIRKIKRLSMKHGIKLKESRKKFCKKCLFPYKNPKIRIKKNIKIIKCGNCSYESRWKLKQR